MDGNCRDRSAASAELLPVATEVAPGALVPRRCDMGSAGVAAVVTTGSESGYLQTEDLVTQLRL